MPGVQKEQQRYVARLNQGGYTSTFMKMVNLFEKSFVKPWFYLTSQWLKVFFLGLKEDLLIFSK